MARQVSAKLAVTRCIGGSYGDADVGDRLIATFCGLPRPSFGLGGDLLFAAAGQVAVPRRDRRYFRASSDGLSAGRGDSRSPATVVLRVRHIMVDLQHRASLRGDARTEACRQ